MHHNDPLDIPVPARDAIPDIGKLTIFEVWRALQSGWHDFRRAPLFGIFFAAFYVIFGIALYMIGAGVFTWTLVLSLGFPLVAPFAAVGLYEVSRRLENHEPLDWADVLGVVWAERGRQIPWIGAILVMVFLFWSFFAHMLMAMFLGSMEIVNIHTSWEVFQTPTGMMMIAAELIIGALVAFFVFSITVVSLPLLLDKEIDFVTAMLVSMRAVAANKGVMLIWAAIIAALVLIAMVPMFLGLLLVLPVLGHATWHLYRRALYTPV
jgi:uncharacterized membrane protein